jgi:UDP-N-acetylglucosamine acyltransferase
MARVHPTAIVEKDCELADDVEVGPYSIVRSGSVLGAGTTLDAHCLIEHTTLGRECHLHFGAALGGVPQDQSYRSEPTRVLVGDRNTIREYVTVHRATGEGNATRLGNDNMLMASTHLGHNCELGDQVTLSTLSGMSGHTIIEDHAIIGGMVGSHQRVRVGKLAMVSGFSKMSQDIPPFCLADGKPARVIGRNLVGLRRAGYDSDVRRALQRAFRLIYRSGLDLAGALDRVANELGSFREVQYLVEFINRMRNGRVGRQQETAPRESADGS